MPHAFVLIAPEGVHRIALLITVERLRAVARVVEGAHQAVLPYILHALHVVGDGEGGGPSELPGVDIPGGEGSLDTGVHSAAHIVEPHVVTGGAVDLLGKQQVAGAGMVDVHLQLYAVAECGGVETEVERIRGFPGEVAVGQTGVVVADRLIVAEEPVSPGSRKGGYRQICGDGVVAAAAGARTPRQLTQPLCARHKRLVLHIPAKGDCGEETPFAAGREVRSSVGAGREGEVVFLLIVVVGPGEERYARAYGLVIVEADVARVKQAVHVLGRHVVVQITGAAQVGVVHDLVLEGIASESVEIVPPGP